MENRKTTTDALEILHRRFYQGKPARLKALEKVRANEEIARKHSRTENQGGPDTGYTGFMASDKTVAMSANDRSGSVLVKLSASGSLLWKRALSIKYLFDIETGIELGPSNYLFGGTVAHEGRFDMRTLKGATYIRLFKTGSDGVFQSHYDFDGRNPRLTKLSANLSAVVYDAGQRDSQSVRLKVLETTPTIRERWDVPVFESTQTRCRPARDQR